MSKRLESWGYAASRPQRDICQQRATLTRLATRSGKRPGSVAAPGSTHGAPSELASSHGVLSIDRIPASADEHSERAGKRPSVHSRIILRNAEGDRPCFARRTPRFRRRRTGRTFRLKWATNTFTTSPARVWTPSLKYSRAICVWIVCGVKPSEAAISRTSCSATMQRTISIWRGESPRMRAIRLHAFAVSGSRR